jgi:hypothetical protein
VIPRARKHRGFKLLMGNAVVNPVRDHSIFSTNRDRLLEADATAKFNDPLRNCTSEVKVSPR